MFVVKRDGSKEEFDVRKIENAVEKAFKACKYPESYIQKAKKRINEFFDDGFNMEGLTVENIQNAVERILMSNPEWFEVGRAYILYREQHKQARLISDKLKYIHKYTESKDSATNLSNTDDNANASNKNAATLESEVYKDINRIIQRGEDASSC